MADLLVSQPGSAAAPPNQKAGSIPGDKMRPLKVSSGVSLDLKMLRVGTPRSVSDFGCPFWTGLTRFAGCF